MMSAALQSPQKDFSSSPSQSALKELGWQGLKCNALRQAVRSDDGAQTGTQPLAAGTAAPVLVAHTQDVQDGGFAAAHDAPPLFEYAVELRVDFSCGFGLRFAQHTAGERRDGSWRDGHAVCVHSDPFPTQNELLALGVPQRSEREEAKLGTFLSPAEASGQICGGDVLLAVNRRSTHNLPYDAVLDLLRQELRPGEVGAAASLHFGRPQLTPVHGGGGAESLTPTREDLVRERLCRDLALRQLTASEGRLVAAQRHSLRLSGEVVRLRALLGVAREALGVCSVLSTEELKTFGNLI